MMQEGRREGREEGMAIGVQQTALRMKQMGLPENLIIEATGLSSKEISEFR